VQDASDLSNIPNESFDWVVAKDVLEHISWRKTESTLREWLRVLRPSGTLQIICPSALQLITILQNPGDKHGTRLSGEGDFEYFNRVLFGHQDYPENAHLAYFTKDWLCDFLVAEGVQEVVSIHSDDRFFHIQAVK
jgi:predicted SAM-dependent methyltransferase